MLLLITPVGYTGLMWIKNDVFGKKLIEPTDIASRSTYKSKLLLEFRIFGFRYINNKYLIHGSADSPMKYQN